jgi:hypothetical protein
MLLMTIWRPTPACADLKSLNRNGSPQSSGEVYDALKDGHLAGLAGDHCFVSDAAQFSTFTCISRSTI